MPASALLAPRSDRGDLLARLIAERDRRQELRRSADLAEESFPEFVAQAWHVLEPGEEFRPGRHINIIGDALEAVLRGEIENLLVNVPPGHMKSLLCNVFFPAWVWIKRPAKRWLFSTYGIDLSTRDARKMRMLIESRWYQDRWGDRFQLKTRGEERFENNKTGVRIASSVGGVGTGEGGNFVMIDDPHKADEVQSDTKRQAVLDWWSGTMASRQRPPGSGGRVVIMQRLHEMDLTGYLLEQGGWDHLCLPAEYERLHPIKCFADWRTTEGELLWPEMFDAERMKTLKREMQTDKNRAGQLQQRPFPGGGGILKSAWWQKWIEPYHPRTTVLTFMSVDTAYTADDSNAPSACTIWQIYTDAFARSRLYLRYAWREFYEFHELITRIQSDAKKFRCKHILVEAKANGLSVIQELRRRSSGLHANVVAIKPRGDKVARAHAVQGILEAGLVSAPARQDEEGTWQFQPWCQTVVDETASFPSGRFKDLTDSTTQAWSWARAQGFEFFEEDAPPPPPRVNRRGPYG